MTTPEPFEHWQWWQREMALQRALTAEADTEKLKWRQLKATTRLHKHVHRLKKHGWLTMSVPTN